MNHALYGVYGTGGCGKGVMPLARRQLADARISTERLVFIDDSRAGETLNGHLVMSHVDFSASPASERFAVVAIANGTIRERVATRCSAEGIQPWSVIAANALTMDDVQIGEGAVLCPFVTLTTNISIGRHFQANLYSYVEHDCIIGDYVTFAPGVKCNGNVWIGDHAYIGSGAVIRQGVPGRPLRIGSGATIGMGAVVTRDVPAGVTVVGNPARLLQKKGDGIC